MRRFSLYVAMAASIAVLVSLVVLPVVAADHAVKDKAWSKEREYSWFKNFWPVHVRPVTSVK